MPTVRADGTALTQDVRRSRGRSAASSPSARATEPAEAAERVGPSPGAELVLARYRLGRRLGSGAFGTVFAARDERLERDVAVKLLPRERVIGGRFEREARAAARLQHPGIVTLYEAAVDDDGAYLVSELVRGRTLDRLLESGQLSDREILRIGAALCEALEHAHEQGVVHRDVKPSNVLVPSRPSSPAHPAKLTDFGVASVIGGDSLTRTGDVIGTAAYMAPEQAEGREVTAAADLYALALTLYEGLTGVNPVRGLVEAGRSPRSRLSTYLPPLRRHRRDLPRGLGAALDRALRPRPSERGSLAELRSALGDAILAASDRTGVVAPAWGEHDVEPGPRAGWGEPEETPLPATGPKAGGTDQHVKPVEPLPERLLCAAAAGAAVAWLTAHLLHGAPVAPLGAGLVAAGVVLILPRLGWWAAVVTLVAMAFAQARGGDGVVLLLGAGAAGLALLLHPRAWPLPAVAPLLGLAGLAGAWPAVAGRARWPAAKRAGVAAGGYLFTVAAGLATGQDLLWRPSGLPAHALWSGSLPVMGRDVLVPLAGAGALAGAGVWALSAVVLPWIARGRRPGLEAGLVCAWSVLTVVGVEACGARPLHGALVGALAGGALALAPVVGRQAGRPGIRTRVP